jgi:DNA invertase Pin-like site-specific DNA recombinase
MATQYDHENPNLIDLDPFGHELYDYGEMALRDVKVEGGHVEDGRTFQDLVLVRESNVSDFVLFAGMVAQSLAFCHDLPGTKTVSDLGVRPLSEPGSMPFPVEILTHGDAKAALFANEGVLYLYSMSGAALRDFNGDNGFTQILCHVVEKHRPRRVRVAVFSRLVRSIENGGVLLNSLIGNVEEIRVGSQRIPLSGPEAGGGKLMFQTMCIVSASERDAIVQRLVAGIVNKHRRGEWIRSSESLLPGFVVSDGRLSRDDSQRNIVRDMLTVVADDSKSVNVIIRDLRSLGLVGAHVSQPYLFVRRILARSQLYTKGTTTFRLKNPFPGAQHISGYPVQQPTTKYPDGWLRFDYDLGVPDGGWAPEHILQSLEAQRRNLGAFGLGRGTGGAVHDTRNPFTGIAWERGDQEFFISTQNTHDLVVLRRPNAGEVADA